MDSKRLKQIVNQLKRSLEKFGFDKRFTNSNDETQTRDFLIHPFFEEIMGYNKMTDFSHEILADVGGKRARKVDIAITLGGKKPLILVECKKAGTNLNDNHFRQLNEYCRNTTSSKVGILTDGVKYHFYSQNKSENNNLYDHPFFTFNMEDYGTSDLEMLALFCRTDQFEMNTIIEEAEEIYFLSRFDDALFELLKTPTDNLLKEIYVKMGGKRSTERILSQIKDLVNSTSLKTALEKVIQHEVSSSNSGIITTEEEIKAFNVIKTIIALSSKINNKDLERVSFRDLKGSFTILVDENQNKKICALILKERSKSIVINSSTYNLQDTTVVSLTKFKKELIDSAISKLG